MLDPQALLMAQKAVDAEPSAPSTPAPPSPGYNEVSISNKLVVCALSCVYLPFATSFCFRKVFFVVFDLLVQIVPLEDTTPLAVFINPKSGGNQGAKVGCVDVHAWTAANPPYVCCHAAHATTSLSTESTAGV